jgi:hypothetical protein
MSKVLAIIEADIEAARRQTSRKQETKSQAMMLDLRSSRHQEATAENEEAKGKKEWSQIAALPSQIIIEKRGTRGTYQQVIITSQHITISVNFQERGKEGNETSTYLCNRKGRAGRVWAWG